MNIALLLKWVWRIYQGEDTIWANLIRAKYNDATDLFGGTTQGGSQFWKSLHKVKHLFKVGAKHDVLDGTRTSFWLDWLLRDAPRKDRTHSHSYSQFATIQQFQWSWPYELQAWIFVSAVP
jgi:hypothetical protein